MHPTAVLLALHGCVPCCINAHHLRIMARPVQSAPMLYYVKSSVGLAWSIAKSADPSAYVPAEWGAFPDSDWARLTDNTLQLFLDSL